MRANGVILENLDGFEDLDDKFTLRGVPHVLALRDLHRSPDGPRTGWGATARRATARCARLRSAP